MLIAERDKVCETCKYYQEEFNGHCGACMKDPEYPVAFEPYETCDDWKELE
jgi:hypothetical protein